jgi:transposase-like protein
MLRVIASEQSEQDELKLDLDALVREGARRMLLMALNAEVDNYVAQHADHRDDVGHALVVRNGVAEPRTVTTGAGELEIQAPRVNDRREGRRFTSAILPPWARRSPKVAEVLPVLYLRGISTKDFEPALAEFFGSEAGLSASTIQRLTREWGQELTAFQQRDLSQIDYVYLWADGVHFNIRLEHERLCCLVLIGVRADGRKELVAVGDGYRESTESWSELLRDLKRRGMCAPVLAIGDGALGFWGALREVFPESREQRCWVHRIRKESTYRSLGAWWCCGEQFGRGAVAGGRLDEEVPVLLEEGTGFADDVADGCPADVAQGVGEDGQGAQPPLVQDREQDAFGVADLLREDAAASTGLAWATAPLVAEAFGLSGLPGGESLGEGVQLSAGESNQSWVGEPLDDRRSRGAPITVQKGEQVGGGGEADRGHTGVKAVVVEHFAGLFDVVTDARGSDLQEVSKHVHRADLPLVYQREQKPRRIIEQRPLADLAAGPPRPTAALFAVALLGAGGLGWSEPGGELLELGSAQAGQSLIGKLIEDGLTTLGRAACFANGCQADGVGGVLAMQGVVPDAVGGMPL